MPLNHPDEHFSRSEYLLADSGFTASDQMVPMFRKTAGDTIMRGRPAYLNTVAPRCATTWRRRLHFSTSLNAVLREMWRMVVADQLFSGNIRRSHLTKLTQRRGICASMISCMKSCTIQMYRRVNSLGLTCYFYRGFAEPLWDWSCREACLACCPVCS